MNLAVLRAQARDVATRQAARLQAAIDENRELTEDEETADAADKAELARLTAQIRRAEERKEREQAQLSQQKMQTAFSVGTSILGALLGRKTISATNMRRVGSAASSAGRTRART